MLFIILGTVKEESATQDRLGKRAQWRYPEGVGVVAEYWPIGSPYGVITVAEAEDAGVIMAALLQWDDHFYFSVHPAVTAEYGLAIIADMLG